MAHSKPDGESRVSLLRGVTESVTAQRRAVAAIAAAFGVIAFVCLQTSLGSTVAVCLASVGTAGAVFTSGILLVCHAYGHVVECTSGTFCECKRCGQPMDDWD
jgi:hypothetical protein